VEYLPQCRAHGPLNGENEKHDCVFLWVHWVTMYLLILK